LFTLQEVSPQTIREAKRRKARPSIGRAQRSTAASSAEDARLSALHRGSCRNAGRLGSIQAALHATKCEGVTSACSARLSEAPRAAAVVPPGSMPGPPGSGVTSPTRRNRTRSVSRPSPVDVPHEEQDERLYSDRSNHVKEFIPHATCADKSVVSALVAACAAFVTPANFENKDSPAGPMNRSPPVRSVERAIICHHPRRRMIQ
jgi:hypothetical protein